MTALSTPCGAVVKHSSLRSAKPDVRPAPAAVRHRKRRRGFRTPCNVEQIIEKSQTQGSDPTVS